MKTSPTFLPHIRGHGRFLKKKKSLCSTTTTMLFGGVPEHKRVYDYHHSFYFKRISYLLSFFLFHSRGKGCKKIESLSSDVVVISLNFKSNQNLHQHTQTENATKKKHSPRAAPKHTQNSFCFYYYK